MITAYAWDSNWKITLLVLVAVPILCSLGNWQLNRAEEKRALQQHFIQQSAKLPLTEDELLAAEFETSKNRYIHAARRVAIRGSYLNEQNVLLDNQIFNGRVGYQVLTPFVTELGNTFLVNRGWLAGTPDRKIPRITAVAGVVDIVATVYQQVGETVVLQEDTLRATTPLLVQRVVIDQFNQLWGREMFELELRLQQGFPGALDIDWPLINTGPEKHVGYAVQWFFMAVAVTAFWIYSSLRKTN